MLDSLPPRLKGVVDYLSDAAHRRSLVTVIAMAGAHITGKAIDGDSLALILDLVVGLLAGAWTNTADKGGE